jgi:hypothetical protein
LLAANENPKKVSERLGHATIVLMPDTDSHFLPSTQKDATEKLENLLYKNTPESVRFLSESGLLLKNA